MFGRGRRALRRLALVIPLLLTAAALLLLPRPIPTRPQSDPEHQAPSLEDASVPEPLLYQPNSNGLAELALEEEPGNLRSQQLSRRPWYMSDGERRPVYNEHALVFPEEAPSHDRIENQLMYALPEEANVPIKSILIANGRGAFNVPGGRSEFIRNKCPVSECTIVENNADQALNADAILFKDHFVSFNVPRPTYQIWILYYLECPYHTPSLRSPAVDIFNWTATYRQDSDIVAPYEKWVYHDPLVTQMEQERNYAANKTAKVAWFVSNCHARNRRHQFAKKLSKYITVDIYGACGTHHCPRHDPKCLELLDKKYKFYLAFENSNCKDYITEKFFVNGLQHSSVPIVMGARPVEYQKVAPYHSFIHVEDFPGPQELAEYLHKLDADDDLYNSYFKWKGTGEFINTYFFCRLCAMLHANDRKMRNTFYEDAQSWWRSGTCIRDDWRDYDSSGILLTEADMPPSVE